MNYWTCSLSLIRVANSYIVYARYKIVLMTCPWACQRARHLRWHVTLVLMRASWHLKTSPISMSTRAQFSSGIRTPTSSHMHTFKRTLSGAQQTWLMRDLAFCLRLWLMEFIFKWGTRARSRSSEGGNSLYKWFMLQTKYNSIELWGVEGRVWLSPLPAEIRIWLA